MEIYAVFARDRYGANLLLKVPQKKEPHRRLTTLSKMMQTIDAKAFDPHVDDALRGHAVGRINALTSEMDPTCKWCWCSVTVRQEPPHIITAGQILPAKFYLLTADHWAILTLLELNPSGSAIARELNLPVRTVNQRLKNIAERLGVPRDKLLEYCRRWQVREFFLEWTSPSGGGLILPGLAAYREKGS